MRKKSFLLAMSGLLMLHPLVYAESSHQILFSIGSSSQSFDDVTGNLNNKQYTNTSISGDERDTAWKVSYQKSMKGNTSLNIGYIDLGSNTADIETSVPVGKTDGMVAKEIAESLPVRGQGVVASMLYHMPLATVLDGNFGLGAYIYQDERTATFRGATEIVKKNSASLMSHAGVSYKITPDIALHGEWEHYFMPGEDVDYIGVGMSYSF